MVLEAQYDLWNSDTRKCLATTHVYSSQAAAAEDQLLSEILIYPTQLDRRSLKIDRALART